MWAKGLDKRRFCHKMVASGKMWGKVEKHIARDLGMAENLQSLSELAREMNAALVRAGRASWRREFNARLWACNRDRALALIAEYRQRLTSLVEARGWDETSEQLFSPLRS
jgi:hypothetical protein